jgi:hypothetical protein
VNPQLSSHEEPLLTTWPPVKKTAEQECDLKVMLRFIPNITVPWLILTGSGSLLLAFSAWKVKGCDEEKTSLTCEERGGGA